MLGRVERGCRLGYLGDISDPCCIKAPRENQSVLEMVKVLVAEGSLPPSSDTCHS